MLKVNEVALIAAAAVANHEPFAMIRLGDGEARVLAWPDAISRGELDRRLSRWFGRKDFTDSQITEMRNELEVAIKQVDVVGMPERDDYMKWRRQLWDSVDTDGKVLCSCDVHAALWDQGLLRPIIEQASTITLLTCRDVENRFTSRFDIEPEMCIIPPQAFSKMPTDHYPKRYGEVCRQIDKTAQGLWLVGAGVLGKIYCARIQQAGAVALDMGSIFDGWAGLKTRSYLHKKRYQL